MTQHLDAFPLSVHSEIMISPRGLDVITGHAWAKLEIEKTGEVSAARVAWARVGGRRALVVA